MYVLSPNRENTWASTHKGRKREKRNGRRIKEKKIPVGWRKRGRRPKFLDTQREKRNILSLLFVHLLRLEGTELVEWNLPLCSLFLGSAGHEG